MTALGRQGNTLFFIPDDSTVVFAPALAERVDLDALAISGGQGETASAPVLASAARGAGHDVQAIDRVGGRNPLDHATVDIGL
ncbi:hypothetical protein [Nocardiopsis sp. JB363]|uniref:hypothetical protein n=1 Tax=Nocardiopsis sp. JB363 TaxID=1434837 RepID=UPI00097B0A3C|nr:hypothetical protein [Nocardiopsis sp. JB363]SIO86463.1 hypothetical protein BQ8420_12130 [Nocardiopsis sp. JB363]